jgi:maltose alpha-D-glucosyltransferase/alpha-amylase
LDGKTIRVPGAELVAVPLLESPVAAADTTLPISVRRSERNNTAVEFGQEFILKTFRRAEDGVNPDLEIGRYLARQTDYHGSAPIAGYVEYRRRGGEPATLAVLHRYVTNHGTAWQHALDQLSTYFERAAAISPEQRIAIPPLLPLVGTAEEENESNGWLDLIGGSLEMARLLGQRTGDLHLALSTSRANPVFSPEPLSKLYQRSVYQTMRNQIGRVAQRLYRVRDSLPPNIRELADVIVDHRDAILKRFRAILDIESSGMRIRCHGDFHLGQLLFTGKDFVVIDFEGEAARPLEDRRVKRSPLRDVACMNRSFDYVVRSVLLGFVSHRGHSPGVIRPEDCRTLEPWADAWVNRVSRAYVSEYLKTVQTANLLPPAEVDQRLMLELFALEKGLQETENELSSRPAWAELPLRGVFKLMGFDPQGSRIEL